MRRREPMDKAAVSVPALTAIDDPPPGCHGGADGAGGMVLERLASPGSAGPPAYCLGGGCWPCGWSQASANAVLGWPLAARVLHSANAAALLLHACWCSNGFMVAASVPSRMDGRN